MRTSRHQYVRALLAGVILAQSGMAAAELSAEQLHTRALAATCANCHGTEGKPAQSANMARLAGKSREHMAAQMRAFKDGSRQATVMHQIAKGYTDQQIESIAAYFAAIQ